jgi:predicted transcriptional regulator of viral defense system
MVDSSFKRRALQIAHQQGIARTRDFAAAGIPRVYLQRLRDEGQLVQTGRGLYQLPDAEFSAAHSLAEAACIVPRGVVCLLSALQYHGLTTQTPREAWMLLASKDWAPKNPAVAIKVVRASGEGLTAGIERQRVPVPVTIPAKTVADCFKYRNKIGLDVAIEALKDCLRLRRATIDDSGAMLPSAEFRTSCIPTLRRRYEPQTREAAAQCRRPCGTASRSAPVSMPTMSS